MITLWVKNLAPARTAYAERFGRVLTDTCLPLGETMGP
jgi:hypothetical protein